jgi:flagellar motor switch protein FliM
VRFNAVLMSPRDLITLRPGDIVPLEHPVTNPLAVTSAGVTFAHAVAGSSGHRLACLVVPPPLEEGQ